MKRFDLSGQLHEVEKEIVFRKRLYGARANSGDMNAADELRRRARPEEFDEVVGDMYRFIAAICSMGAGNPAAKSILDRARPYCSHGIEPGELFAQMPAGV